MKNLLILAIGITFLFAFTYSQDEKLKKSMDRGKSVYADFCVTCHKTNGEGTIKFFPPLAKSDYLDKERTESIKSVKYGQKGKITVNGVEYNGMMPDPGLTVEEVADVMNYVMNSWGNKSKKMVTVEEVQKIVK